MLLLLAGVSACGATDTADNADTVGLWPAIEPYRSDYLKVSDVHEIYFELCGNPSGKPVLVLHGGPGSGCSPGMRRYFNPEKFHIVLHDQRGAGRSRPYADLRDNTTQHLVEDIERLRRHLDLGKVLLFGGSWGSTLGLAYAEAYPENVSGMILRGIFTATREEIDHFYHGGVGKFFPETYDKFVSALPDPQRRPLPGYLLELIQSDDPDRRALYSRVWAEYEIKIASLEFPDEAMEGLFESFDPFAFALIENYYMSKSCFFEEGQLLRDADKIGHIRTILVNGRYDMICPPINAYRLNRKLPNSKLVFAESAGHWMGDEPVQRALLRAVREFE